MKPRNRILSQSLQACLLFLWLTPQPAKAEERPVLLTDLLGTWKGEGEQGQKITIEYDKENDKLLLHGKHEWVSEDAYSPKAGKLDLVHYPTAAEMQGSTKDGKEIPEDVKTEVTKGDSSQRLKWKLELRVERGHGPLGETLLRAVHAGKWAFPVLTILDKFPQIMRGDPCELSLKGDFLRGEVYWNEVTHQDVKVQQGAGQPHVYKNVRHYLPPLPNGLVFGWKNSEGPGPGEPTPDVQQALGYEGSRYIINEEVNGTLLVTEALSDLGNLGAYMFKGFMAGASIAGMGAETLEGKLAQSLFESFVEDKLKGKDVTYPPDAVEAVGKALAAFFLGELTGKSTDFEGLSGEYVKDTLEQVGVLFGEQGTEKAFEQLKEQADNQCCLKLHKIALSSGVRGAVIVDTRIGEARFLLSFPQTLMKKHDNKECPWVILVGTLSGLPEEGSYSNLLNKRVDLSILSHGKKDSRD
jgi:hypothetical protein